MVLISVTESTIRQASDPLSFRRGETYAARGAVRNFAAEGSTVRATVDGSRPYRVTLTIGASGLDGECTCPYGQDGVFCKHCVATALVWLDDEPSATDAPQATGSNDEALRAFLCKQDPEWLADELMGAANADPLLRARLDVAAGTDPRQAYDDAELRGRLEDAIALDDFVEYARAWGYTSEVHAALDDVEALIEQGFADAAIGVAEYALELLEEAMQLVDDSDGGVGDAMRRAEQIHLAACRAGNPDRVALADRVATRALSSDWEVFLTALPDYADVLGADGMARYREIVESAWRRLPPKQPGEFDFGRFTPTFLMERLAECEGGTDALIDVIARDEGSSYDVLRIAEALVADGRDDEAAAWANDGLARYRPDPRLRTLAAECHLRAGRRDDALQLLWANFAERPNLETYQRLHGTAGEAFSEWRPRALELLREQPRSTGTPDPRHMFAVPADHSALVEVLLWERDIDAAWSAAQDGGCRSPLWVDLARERGKSHPADAVPILQDAAERAIEGKQRKSYREAARLLREARTFASRSGADGEFDAYVRRLRGAHKAKRALREELDHAGLP